MRGFGRSKLVVAKFGSRRTEPGSVRGSRGRGRCHCIEESKRQSSSRGEEEDTAGGSGRPKLVVDRSCSHYTRPRSGRDSRYRGHEKHCVEERKKLLRVDLVAQTRDGGPVGCCTRAGSERGSCHHHLAEEDTAMPLIGWGEQR